MFTFVAAYLLAYLQKENVIVEGSDVLVADDRRFAC